MRTHFRLRVYVGHKLFMLCTLDGLTVVNRYGWDLGVTLEVFQPTIAKDGVTSVR
jgi:hypothetical protein